MTLNILPEVGLREIWRWKTDILQTWNGTESRLSLWDQPRVEERFTFNAVDFEERTEYIDYVARNLNLPGIFPLWAWSARITQTSLSGTTLLIADTTKMSIADGDKVVLLNPLTRETITDTVGVITDSSFNVNTALAQDVGPPWLAFKAMDGLLGNDSTVRWDSVTGGVQGVVTSWVEPSLQRTGSSAALTTLDSLPVLEERILNEAEENPEFPRDVTDFGGAREVGTRYTNLRLNGKVRFFVDRSNDEQVDYWRLFLDTIKGRWKAFLMSTQREDFTLASPLVQGGGTIEVNESLADFLDEFETYQYLQIRYSDGTVSNHKISSVSGTTITLTDTLPNDPKVANVDLISYLLKTRMADRCQWTHDAVTSILSTEFTTTNDG